jgi:hypothetical protein
MRSTCSPRKASRSLSPKLGFGTDGLSERWTNIASEESLWMGGSGDCDIFLASTSSLDFLKVRLGAHNGSLARLLEDCGRL